MWNPASLLPPELGGAQASADAAALGAEERALLGRLFRLLAEGERLAESSALRSAQFAPSLPEARFLRAQARQERMHAHVFEFGARLLAAQAHGSTFFVLYAARLDVAAERGDYAQCLVALQVLLEGVGEAVLHGLDQGMEQRGMGFARLRRLLLRQEAAHHRFGHATLRHMIADGRARPPAVESAAAPYLDDIGEWLVRERDLALGLGLDANALVDALRLEVRSLGA